MAIAATLLTSSYDNVDRTSYTTASISPAADSLLLVFVTDTITAGSAPRSVPTGLSLTWELLGYQVFGASPATRISGAWIAQCGGSPGSGTITLTENDMGSGTTSTGTGWAVIQVTGHHATQPVRQVQYPRTGTFPTISGWSDAASTLPLLPAVDSNSRAFSYFTHQQDEVTTFRTNWTELSDNQGVTPNMAFESQWRSDAFETTASATWASSTRHFGFAIEIAEAAAPSTPRATIVSYAETPGILASSVNVAMPAGVTAGELLVAYVAADANSSVAAGGGEGWTSITDASNGSAVRLKILAKIAAGGDALTLTVGASTDTATYVQRIKYHGVTNVASDITVGTAATGTSSTPDPPSVTPPSAKQWLVMACAAADDDDNVITFSYHPTGYVPLAQTESSSATTSSMLDAACDVQTTGSAINPGTFTMAASEEWVAQTLLIPPASSNVTGTAAATEAADTSTASGTETFTGTSAVTEAADVSTASGAETFTGTVAVTEAADTSTADGTITITVTGTSAATEADDTSTASGTETFSGTSTTTEEADTSAASGTETITGTVAVTEAADTSTASGTSAVNGDIAATLHPVSTFEPTAATSTLEPAATARTFAPATTVRTFNA
jgi:hypothetical protein